MKEKWKGSWCNCSSNQSCYNWYFIQEIYTRWQKKKKSCFRLPAYFWIWVTSSEIRRLLESTEKFPFLKSILTKNSVRSGVCLAYHCIHEPCPISPSRITYSSRIKYLSLHMAILVGIICISSGTTKLWPSKRQDLLHLWVPRNNHRDWCRE